MFAVASALSNGQNYTCARKTLQTQRGRMHGAGCVRQRFRTAEPLRERPYENWNTHTQDLGLIVHGMVSLMNLLVEYAVCIKSIALKFLLKNCVQKLLTFFEEKTIAFLPIIRLKFYVSLLAMLLVLNNQAQFASLNSETFPKKVVCS